MKNVVLCGSMKVLNNIVEVQKQLEDMGYNVLMPEECIKGLPKQIASRAHFDRIIDPNNEIILIVNATKNGIENYIGPNSFAEIAMAFQFNKETYLLNDIYNVYEDELTGWGVKTLNGNLNNLK